ncbi:MAG TPA: pyrroline-5-carboxylate reductase [Desulfotomaculum sp.]|nr:pyrroline-5-carboxylate reductase [Desulfotomaculum sp.]
MPLTKLNLGFVGGGAIAEAILTGLIRSGLSPQAFFVSEIKNSRLTYLSQKLGINPVRNNFDLVKNCDIIILAVKPAVVEDVMLEIGPEIRADQTLISLAAGITTGFFAQFMPEPRAVVRVMPNATVLVGEGACAYCLGTHAQDKDKERVKVIFESTGKFVEVPESLMDVVTGLSGSGPAYMYLIMESFASAGVRLGLPKEEALILSAQTMLGAAKMVLETGEHPAKLKDKVITPGGTTAAGLFSLEEGSLRAIIMRAVEKATVRSRELGK